QAAPRGRAGGSGRARPVRDDLAGHREAPARRRRAARRHRAAAGRPAAGVDPRDRNPPCADRGIRSGGSGRGHRGRRSRVDRRRSTSPTKWAAAVAQQLLARHGVITREAVGAEAIPGGFGSVYPVLKAMEDSGRVRRGYFVAGLGATQFALPGALDLLRSLRDAPDEAEVAVLAATDPASPYGAMLKWPATLAADAGRGPTRTVGATVILVDGALGAYLAP